jgi:hypothetical protein
MKNILIVTLILSALFTCKKKENQNPFLSTLLIFSFFDATNDFPQVKVIGKLKQNSYPLQNALVKTTNHYRSMRASAGMLAQTTTDENGQFELRLKKGIHSIEVSKDNIKLGGFHFTIRSTRDQINPTLHSDNRFELDTPLIILELSSMLETGAYQYPKPIQDDQQTTDTEQPNVTVEPTTQATDPFTIDTTINSVCEDGEGISIQSVSVGDILISEVSYDMDTTKGFEGSLTGTLCTEADDEFIEIYNRSNNSINLRGSSIQYGNSSGNFSIVYEFKDNCIIHSKKSVVIIAKDAGCYSSETLYGRTVLFKGSSFSFSSTGATYSLVASKVKLPDAQTGALINAGGLKILDYIGTENLSVVFQGQRAAKCNDASSYRKEPDTNTENNFADFTCGSPNGTPGEKESVNSVIFSQPSGALIRNTEVYLSSSTTDSLIYYTTDGTEPNCFNVSSGNSIVVNSNITIKAIACKIGLRESSVSSATFSMVENRLPNFSFETYPDSWTLKTAGSVTVYENSPILAADGLKYISFSTLTTTIGGRELLSGCVSIVPEKKLFVQGNFYTPEDVSNTKVSFKVYYYQDTECLISASKLSDTQTSFSLENSNLWKINQYHRETAQLPPDVLSVKVSIRAQYVSGLGTSASKLYFDNIFLGQ